MKDYGYWILVKYVNCQSWEEQTIELKPGLNVFEALNETGKSVLFKALKLAVAYDTNRYSRRKKKTIVRNWEKPNADPAELTIMTSKNYIVNFVFTTNSVTTITIEPDGKIERYKGPAQEHALEILGLKVNKDNKRILNILDNEDPMLFDGTDNKYNDSILTNFITHPVLKKLYESGQNLAGTYSSKIKNLRRIEKTLKEQIVRKPIYGDLDYVSVTVGELEMLDQELDESEKLLEALSGLRKTKERSTTEQVPELEAHLKELEIEKKLIIIATNLSTLTDRIVLETSELDKLNEELLGSKEVLERVSCILDMVDEKRTMSKVEQEDLDYELDSLNLDKEFIYRLAKLKEIEYKKTLISKESESLKNEYMGIVIHKDILKLLIKMLCNLKDIENYSAYMVDFKKDTKEVYSIINYCPVCGNKILGGDCDHE